jgi:protein-L-isoaspartate(D-aspartate) O-methyltransferase
LRRRNVLALSLSSLFVSCPAGELRAEDDEAAFAAQRAKLVEWLGVETQLTADDTGIEQLDPRILAAIGKVPRHRFVPEPLRAYSYLPQPLPVHPEQNLAAPFLAALMLHLARLAPDDVVYETGTDTGYGAALLSTLVRQVYTVELISELAASARRTLAELGYRNVEVREGDGYFGWPEHAPFDVVIVKEQVDSVPGTLLAQLKAGGRMILPVGGLEAQQLTVIEKQPGGRTIERPVLPVRFSPFQGGQRT